MRLNANRKTRLGLPIGKHIFGTANVGEKWQIVIPKAAIKLFNIKVGDTLLILGDESSRIIITRPDVINEAANKVSDNLDNA